jgi:hypothetical protein
MVCMLLGRLQDGQCKLDAIVGVERFADKRWQEQALLIKRLDDGAFDRHR